jgi:hypothetical protein
MFYFRINKIRIIENMENPKFLGIFGDDLAQVKIVSFITSDSMQLPDISKFIITNQVSKKRTILSEAVRQVVNSRVLTTIQNVKDNHIMYFGDTGYVLYSSKTIPYHLDWQLVAYESDRNIEDAALLTETIISNNEFDNFSDNLMVLLKKVKNPGYIAAAAIGKFAAKIIAQIAKSNKDDMIGIMYMSLNRMQHYPHGIRNKINVPDMTNNMYIDYSLFGFDE